MRNKGNSYGPKVTFIFVLNIHVAMNHFLIHTDEKQRINSCVISYQNQVRSIAIHRV